MSEPATKYDTGARAVFATRESTATPQTPIEADGRRRRGTARFTPEQVCMIRTQHASGVKTATLSQQYGVSPDAIEDIVNRNTYAWVMGPN